MWANCQGTSSDSLSEMMKKLVDHTGNRYLKFRYHLPYAAERDPARTMTHCTAAIALNGNYYCIPLTDGSGQVSGYLCFALKEYHICTFRATHQP